MRAKRLRDVIHVGTLWGLASRLLYILVGLAPLFLFITGVVMWRYRQHTP